MKINKLDLGSYAIFSIKSEDKIVGIRNENMDYMNKLKQKYGTYEKVPDSREIDVYRFDHDEIQNEYAVNKNSKIRVRVNELKATWLKNNEIEFHP